MKKLKKTISVALMVIMLGTSVYTGNPGAYATEITTDSQYAVSETSEQIAEETAEESTEDAAYETTGESGGETVGEPVIESTGEVVDETTGETEEKIPDESVEGISTGDVSKTETDDEAIDENADMTEESADEYELSYKESPEDIVKDVPRDEEHMVMTDPEMVVSELEEEDLDIQTITGTGSAVKLKSSVLNENKRYEGLSFNQKNNGIYFIEPGDEFYTNSQEYNIIFYDISKNTYKTVYSIAGQEEYYVTDDAVYFAETSYDSLTNSYVKNGKTYICRATVTVTKYDFNKKTASSVILDSFDLQSYWAGVISAIGVDSKNRIYIASAEGVLYLYNSSGKMLSKCTTTQSIDEFFGFDSTNGNFYYRGYYNWVYWGYDHDMASLMAGNVSSSNKIAVAEKNLSILYQIGFFTHYRPVEMINGKYLAILSTFSSNLLTIVDSNVYKYTDYTEQTTYINLANGGGVSVSPLNISNEDAQKLAVYTADSEYDTSDTDISSVGSRCVIGPKGDSVIVKTDDNTLTEYKLSTGKAKVKCTTAYPVYDMAIFGSEIVAIEKKGSNYYVETIKWTYPSDYSVDIPASMKVGGSAKISCTANTDLSMSYTYSSSDSGIVSVDSRGNLSAWKAGSAVITIKSSPGSIQKKFTIKVSASDVSKNVSKKETNTSGVKSTTIHNTSSVQIANLEKISSDKYERVEYIDGKLYVETYDSNYKLLSSKTVSTELTKYGGCYYGDKYRYVVYGQNNPNESNSVEVIRVVKYDTNWKRISACSIKGANTSIPFNYGLDMTETGGMLYIHTCHTMYQSSDGYNHQANCTFVIKESSMSLRDSYYDVGNISCGYVSHSFAQRITTDGDYIYRVDLGDAYPRGIAYTKTSVNNSVSSPNLYGTMISIPGDTGDNYTGYSLGGLEVTENYTVVLGSGIDETTDTQGNVWVYSVGKDGEDGEKTMLTKYSNGSNINIGAMKLVKLNEHQLLAMWEESTRDSNYNYSYTTKMALISEAGKLAGKIYGNNLSLGECQPIVNSKGNVVWYTTDSGSPKFVEINPYRLSEISTFVQSTSSVNVSYRTHIQNKGWESSWSKNGAMSGTSGQGLRLEGINIKVSGDSKLGVQYTTHCQDYGWLPWSANGDMSGTEGEGKRLEAIKIQLNGTDKDKYDIYYRVHAANYGWLNWTKNGGAAGTSGLGYRLEAIQIIVVKKGESFNTNIGNITSVKDAAYITTGGTSPVVGGTTTSAINPVIGGTTTTNVSYRTHVQNVGWQGWKFNGGFSGTSGKGLRLEGINIKLTNQQYTGGISYRTHIQNIGWESSWSSDGTMSGTSGRGLRLEAIQIKLTGEMAKQYDVYYRVHAQNFGWLSWAKNGESAGTAGYAYRLEGIQIVLVPKGGSTPAATYGGVTSTNANSFIQAR